MIWLKFLDAVEEEDKSVQLGLVTHMADKFGKLHLITTDGAEHVAASSVRLVFGALAKVPAVAPSIVIIEL